MGQSLPNARPFIGGSMIIELENNQLSYQPGQYIKGRTIEVSGGITAYLGNYMTKGNYLDWDTKQWMPIESRTYPYKWKRAKPEDPKGLFDIGKDDLCLCNSNKKYKHWCH